MNKALSLSKNALSTFQYRAMLLFFTVFAFLSVSQAATETSEDIAPGRKMAQQATHVKKRWITTDHSKHEILKQTFTSGPQVTKACLSCHTEASLQFHKTIHWTWMDPATTNDKQLGKGGLSINNF